MFPVERREFLCLSPAGSFPIAVRSETEVLPVASCTNPRSSDLASLHTQIPFSAPDVLSPTHKLVFNAQNLSENIISHHPYGYKMPHLLQSLT